MNFEIIKKSDEQMRTSTKISLIAYGIYLLLTIIQLLELRFVDFETFRPFFKIIYHVQGIALFAFIIFMVISIFQKIKKEVSVHTTTETINLATRGKRFVGSTVDGLLFILLFLPIYLILDLGLSVTIISLGLFIFLFLNAYLLYKQGQTLGKKIVGTRIVDMNGNIPNFGNLIFFRYLSLFVPLFGIVFFIGLLFIFGEQRRCLHDYLAGTQVINISSSSK